MASLILTGPSRTFLPPGEGVRFDGRHAVVVGAGRSGRAVALLLAHRGAQVSLLERDLAVVDAAYEAQAKELGVTLVQGEMSVDRFCGADLVSPSPGIAVAKLLPLLPKDCEVLGELELASRCVSEPILAVTGSNGKTTTVTIAARMLEHIGRKVFLGGNIGTPLAEYVLTGERADVLVLEVSSFQLQTCETFRPRVAVLLNFSANHLDYHRDMDEYLAAKMRLFKCQAADELAVLPASLRSLLADRPEIGSRVAWFEARDRFRCPGLPGMHNQANMEAAFLACEALGVTEAEAQSALEGFTTLPHRLELVSEKGGVRYVDDSKATTVEALRAALESCDRPVLLLAGGVFKGGDLAALASLLRRKAKAVALFGASREVFEAAWGGVADLSWHATLEPAVRRLAGLAAPGDVVLLSPATASFDLYRDYKHRGDDFARIVEALP